MKVKLEQSEKQLLYDIGISIENREYEDDELLQIADEVYLEESCNVEKNEKPANSRLIGYNFGANKYHRIVETAKLTSGVMVAISSLFLIFIEFYPKLFVCPYTSDTRLLEITGHNIRIYLLGITFVGIHSIATTYFQSIRRPKISSLLYILRYGGILIPLLYMVPKIMGINGVYLSNALSDTMSGAVALIFLYIDIHSLSKRQRLFEDL
ncbi:MULTISPECIES: MATE family efflux transporter [Terrabacteria group]|uniref:MATE family efflux transporter n=1 Tax=Bacillati TaxID=1783272 RepID=UPI001C6F2E15|nr:MULTISPECIES: MATE family efflux transporter [Terrabacteria group]MBW9212817.1 hypothetical protein [Trueperella sp. zg.1013]